MFMQKMKVMQVGVLWQEQAKLKVMKALPLLQVWQKKWLLNMSYVEYLKKVNKALIAYNQAIIEGNKKIMTTLKK